MRIYYPVLMLALLGSAAAVGQAAGASPSLAPPPMEWPPASSTAAEWSAGALVAWAPAADESLVDLGVPVGDTGLAGGDKMETNPIAAGAFQLSVPFHTQKDGARFESANCGPASLEMVLEAFGFPQTNSDLRWRSHIYQGTAGRGVAPLSSMSRWTVRTSALDRSACTTARASTDGLSRTSGTSSPRAGQWFPW